MQSMIATANKKAHFTCHQTKRSETNKSSFALNKSSKCGCLNTKCTTYCCSRITVTASKRQQTQARNQSTSTDADTAAATGCSRRAGTSSITSACTKTSDRINASSAAEHSRKSATSPSTDSDTLWPISKTARSSDASFVTKASPNASISE